MAFLGPYADPSEALGLAKQASTDATPSLGIAPAPVTQPSGFGAAGNVLPPPTQDPMANAPGFFRWLANVNDQVAHAQGQPGPTDIMRARKLQQDLGAMQFVRNAMKQASDIAAELPPEKQQPYIQARAAEFDQRFGPGNGELFHSLADRRAAFSVDIANAMKADPALRAAYAANGMPGVQKLLTDPSMIERLGKIGDAQNEPVILQKLTQAIPWLQKNKPKEWAAVTKDGFQSTDLEQLNSLLPTGPNGFQLTPEEINTAQHSEAIYRGIGAEPPSDVKERNVAKIKAQVESQYARQIAYNRAIGEAQGRSAGEAGAPPKPLSPAEAAQIEGRANTDYAGLSKQFVAQQNAYDAVQGIGAQYKSTDPNNQDALGALDKGLLFAVARVDNPGAVARLTTVQQLADVAGLPGTLRAQIKHFLGTGSLSEQARQGLQTLADTTFAKVTQNQGRLEDSFRSMVTRQGANGANITPILNPEYRTKFVEGNAGKTAAPQPPTRMTDPKTGRVFNIPADKVSAAKADGLVEAK